MLRVMLVLFILLCLELGVFLVLLPWTSLWEENFFLLRYPILVRYLLNHYVRGVISGLGLLNVWIAVYEFRHFRSTLARLESRT
jgi:hypothetical protein